MKPPLAGISNVRVDTRSLQPDAATTPLCSATLIRALLVPALVSLFGNWNWWMPVWAAKILRVEPSLPNRSPG